jgi:hypothetical protein
MNAQVPEQLPQQARENQENQENQENRAGRADRAGGGPDGAAQPEPSSSFDDEVRSALSYEKGLAAKALVALALVAALVIARLLGF